METLLRKSHPVIHVIYGCSIVVLKTVAIPRAPENLLPGSPNPKSHALNLMYKTLTRSKA